MSSLHARLGTGLVISLVGLFGLQWLVVSAAIHAFTEAYVASRLAHDTASVLAMLTLTSDGQPVLEASHFDPLYHRPLSGYYYEILTATGDALRSRSLWDADLDTPLLAPGKTMRYIRMGPKGQRLLVLISGFDKQNHPVTIAVAENLAPMEAELGQLEKRYVAVSFIILVILIIVQQWMLRLGFRPLHRVRQDMARLERGDIRQLGDAVPTEVRPLVQEMNRLLAVMEQRLQRSRHALGNLAHALKTPLTLVMQLASRDELRTDPQARQQLLAQTETLHHRLERELRRARLAGAALPGRRLRLTEEVPPLIDVLRRIYQDKHLVIECHIPSQAMFAGDREDTLELLGNLLDNACKWARRRVMVVIKDQPGLALMIEDDGPGCPPEVLKQLAERGVRVDESTAGHGLGLAIAKDIVEQYGGDMGFGCSSTLGGFQVRIALPARSPRPWGG